MDSPVMIPMTLNTFWTVFLLHLHTHKAMMERTNTYQNPKVVPFRKNGQMRRMDSPATITVTLNMFWTVLLLLHLHNHKAMMDRTSTF